MGWAAGFQAGTAMSNQWMDTYRRAKQERLMAEQKARADMGEYQQHTAEYGRGLEAKAAERDEFGNPVWDISIKPGAINYDVRRIQYPQRSSVTLPEEPVDYAAWEAKYGRTGLQAPQEGLGYTPASAEAVPMDVLPQERRVLDSDAYSPTVSGVGLRRDEALIRPDLEYVMRGRGAAPRPEVGLTADEIDIASMAQRLGVTPREFSESLVMPTRPQDTAAYVGLRRGMPEGAELGEAEPYPTMAVGYMGKQYAPGTLTPEMKRAAQQEAYANVYEQLGRPEEAMLMRVAAQAARKSALELQNLEASAAKAKNLREIQTDLATKFKERVGDRAPTPDDFDAFDMETVSELMRGGHVDEANAAVDRRNRVTMERIKLEEAGRNQAINTAVAALSTGNLQPTVELYNKFVRDGAKVQKITRDDKTGAITVHRVAADGTDLQDYTFKSIDELSASVRSLGDAGVFADYTQRMFLNNLREREAAVAERRAAADEKRANAYERRANAAESRAERADVVYLTDGKQVFEYKRGSLPYDKSGRMVMPEGLSLYKGAPTMKQTSALTPEQNARYEELIKSDKWKRAKTPDDKARLLQLEGIDPAAVNMGDVGVSGWDE